MKKNIPFEETFVNTRGWMISKLGLYDCRELMLFALIFGFSQDNETEFKGSKKFINKWLRTSKPTIIEKTRKLIEYGYIIKRQEEYNGMWFNRFSINWSVVDKYKNSKEDITPPPLAGKVEKLRGKKSLPVKNLDPPVKKFNGKAPEPGKEILPNISISSDIDINKDKETPSLQHKPETPEQSSSDILSLESEKRKRKKVAPKKEKEIPAADRKRIGSKHYALLTETLPSGKRPIEIYWAATPEIRELIIEYLEYRRAKIKKPFKTARGLNGQLKYFEKHPKHAKESMKILKDNEWQGLKWGFKEAMKTKSSIDFKTGYGNKILPFQEKEINRL